MRIAWNVEHAFSNPTGMGKYPRNLLRALARIDPENEYVLFHSQSTDYEPEFEDLPGNFSLVTIPFPRRWVKAVWVSGCGFVLDQYVGGCDLYHNPSLTALPVRQGKFIVTVPDLACLSHPQAYPLRHRLGARLGALKAARQAHMLIAISEFTKRDIIERLRVPEEKVRMIYYGLEPQFRPVRSRSLRENVRKRFDIDRPYFLFVSDINPRKNVTHIVLAFDRLNQRLKGEYLLVLAGRRGYRSETVAELVDRLLLGHLVRFTGHVGDDELPTLITGARALVYPSLYEGFGLPPVEAMACGTPVIAGNVTAMPEVLGDAAILVDPYDIDELTQAMEYIIRDSNLREMLRKKGRARAKLYSWDKAARETLNLYQELRAG